jgi:phosphoribosylaminoimidazole-succinocarboxamide synthase
MTQPADDGMSAAHAAGDVKLKILVDKVLTEDEARAWLAQTVTPSEDARRTINSAREVQGA